MDKKLIKEAFDVLHNEICFSKSCNECEAYADCGCMILRLYYSIFGQDEPKDFNFMAQQELKNFGKEIR